MQHMSRYMRSTAVMEAAGRTGRLQFPICSTASEVEPILARKPREASAQPGISLIGQVQLAALRAHHKSSVPGHTIVQASGEHGFAPGLAEGPAWWPPILVYTPGWDDSPANPPHAVVSSLPRMQPSANCHSIFVRVQLSGWRVSQRSSIFLSSPSTQRHSFPLSQIEVDARSPRPSLSFTFASFPVFRSSSGILS